MGDAAELVLLVLLVLARRWPVRAAAPPPARPRASAEPPATPATPRARRAAPRGPRPTPSARTSPATDARSTRPTPLESHRPSSSRCADAKALSDDLTWVLVEKRIFLGETFVKIAKTHGNT